MEKSVVLYGRILTVAISHHKMTGVTIVTTRDQFWPSGGLVQALNRLSIIMASYGPSQATLVNFLLWLTRTGPVKATTVKETRVAWHNKTTCAIIKPVLAHH